MIHFVSALSDRAPSLVCSLKDSSLHSSLRQPSFDLIHTIIVSDASALMSMKLKSHASLNVDMRISTDFNDEEDELPFFHDVEEKESSCWNEFSEQSKLTSRECKDWMCIPMLWVDVLIEVDPSTLPISFSKAVFWALSRFSMVEPETSAEMELSVTDWLSSYTGQISFSFGWEVPNGSDDGGNKQSKNSVKASVLCVPLIRAFKRFVAFSENFCFSILLDKCRWCVLMYFGLVIYFCKLQCIIVNIRSDFYAFCFIH